MSSTTCTFGGSAVGDGVLRYSVGVTPNESPDVQTGVKRQNALLSDESPNLTYSIRVRIRLSASTPMDLAKRVLLIGDMKLQGKQSLIITETIDLSTTTLTMDEAILVGDVASPDTSRDTAPMIDNEFVVTFMSANRPN